MSRHKVCLEVAGRALLVSALQDYKNIFKWVARRDD